MTLLWQPTSLTEISQELLRPPPERVVPKPLPKGIKIGYAGNQPLIIPDDERFGPNGTHVHLMGAAGSGNRIYFLSMNIQEIQAGRGVCVIDPHTSLSLMLLRFCALNVDPSRVVLVDVAREDVVTRLNPLQGGSGASLAVEAIIRTAGRGI